jgi:hypothetical protein
MSQSYLMSSQQDALDNLRVIRSLMEKAHIYRAISAPAALVGGVLATAVSLVGFSSLSAKESDITPDEFLFIWLGILAVTAALNVFLLSRDAKNRGQDFVSDGMRMALRAILPPLAVGGILGIGLIVHLQSLTLAALIWIVCYGLALLATASFSPRSLVCLGWTFVAAGLMLFWFWAAKGELHLANASTGPAFMAMGLTFGLLHIIYAVAVFISKKPEVIPAE